MMAALSLHDEACQAIVHFMMLLGQEQVSQQAPHLVVRRPCCAAELHVVQCVIQGGDCAGVIVDLQHMYGLPVGSTTATKT